MRWPVRPRHRTSSARDCTKPGCTVDPEPTTRQRLGGLQLSPVLPIELRRPSDRVVDRCGPPTEFAFGLAVIQSRHDVHQPHAGPSRVRGRLVELLRRHHPVGDDVALTVSTVLGGEEQCCRGVLDADDLAVHWCGTAVSGRVATRGYRPRNGTRRRRRTSPRAAHRHRGCRRIGVRRPGRRWPASNWPDGAISGRRRRVVRVALSRGNRGNRSPRSPVSLLPPWRECSGHTLFPGTVTAVEEGRCVR
jgi:hypothetical protein